MGNGHQDPTRTTAKLFSPFNFIVPVDRFIFVEMKNKN